MPSCGGAVIENEFQIQLSAGPARLDVTSITPRRDGSPIAAPLALLILSLTALGLNELVRLAVCYLPGVLRNSIRYSPSTRQGRRLRGLPGPLLEDADSIKAGSLHGILPAKYETRR